MPSLKFDAIQLIAKGAGALAREGARGAAFSLYELGNALRLVLCGDAPLAEFGQVYGGADREPIDIEAELWPGGAPCRVSVPRLGKLDPRSPVFKVDGRDGVVVKPGVSFSGRLFTEAMRVVIADKLVPGADFAVYLEGGAFVARRLTGFPCGDGLLGGFHYAPGGVAPGCEGGDAIPAVNPFSLWDLNFRPACPDPRGMALVTASTGDFWCDIYLTGVNHHADGTSRFGVTIADGDDRPRDPGGAQMEKFDYETARAAVAAHSKTLLSKQDFFAAAFGVKEKSSAPGDPRVTGLDAPRTSKFGIIQATGNLWIWGHDGDLDAPRASLFGGSWLNGGDAGSRYAYVVDWPDDSTADLGARGRSDHLKLV